MRTRLTLSLVVITSVTLFASCTPGPLEGDWFRCEDEACTTLDDDGVRFTAGGRWGGLEASGGEYKPGEPYELEKDRGSYTLEGNTLTLFVDDSSETFSVQLSFDGDDLLVHGAPQSSVTCIEPAPGATPTPKSTCKQEPSKPKVMRYRRVGDAGEVPRASGPRDDSASDSASTSPPPPSGN